MDYECCDFVQTKQEKGKITCLNHACTTMMSKRERKKAGKAARIAKLISFARRIWSSSSIALVKISS